MVKSSYRKSQRSRKNYSKKVVRSLTTKNVERVVSRMIMKKAESKHKDGSFGKTEIYHNLFSQIQLNQTGAMPTEGSGDDQRIGDQINLGGMCVRMLFGGKADRPNITWRIGVIRVPKGTSLTYGTITNNATGNCLLDGWNKDLVSVLKSKTIKAQQSGLFKSDTATVEYTFPVKLWVPYKKLLKFQTDGSTTHNDHDIHLVIWGYDAFGTLTTDNIGYVQVVNTLYYKDP